MTDEKDRLEIESALADWRAFKGRAFLWVARVLLALIIIGLAVSLHLRELIP